MAAGHHAACGFSAPRRLPCAGPSVATAWLGRWGWLGGPMRRRLDSTRVDGLWRASRLRRLVARLPPLVFGYQHGLAVFFMKVFDLEKKMLS
jgi:hypothetical protein